MKKFLITLFCICFLSTPAFCIEEVQNKPVYYLSDCIKIALNSSQIIKRAKLNYEISKKDVNIVKADYTPTLGGDIHYWQAFNTDKTFDDGYTKRFLPSVGIYLNQLIYNFGKTNAKIDMQKFHELAAEYSYKESIWSIINEVKLEYFTVLEMKSAVEIEKYNLKLSEKILETTERLFKEQKKDEIDCVNAKVYLSSAKMSLAKAENAYKQATIDLANTLNFDDADFEIKNIDTFDYYDAYFSPEFISAPKGHWHELKHRERQKDVVGEIQNLPFTLEYAQEYADKHNLEIHILDSTLEALKKARLAVKREYYPSLNAHVGYGYDSKYTKNSHHTVNNNQMNAAITLDSSLNPFAHTNELSKADYQIELAENELDLLKQDIFYDVQKYYLDVELAELQIKNAIDKVYFAKENLEIAGKNYIEGKVNYIELQNARQNYNTSKLNYISELKNYNIALANLEKTTYINNEEYQEIINKL